MTEDCLNFVLCWSASGRSLAVVRAFLSYVTSGDDVTFELWRLVEKISQKFEAFSKLDRICDACMSAGRRNTQLQIPYVQLFVLTRHHWVFEAAFEVRVHDL